MSQNRSPASRPPPSLSEVEFRKAARDEIFALRHNVLTVGTGRTSSDYPGDLDSTTHHFGAFLRGENIACATFLMSEWEGRAAWQLRGMATTPEYRSKGLGGRLLAFAEQYVCKHSTVHRFWCNARIKAVDFYCRHGWEVKSEPFEIEHVGPHVKMFKEW